MTVGRPLPAAEGSLDPSVTSALVRKVAAVARRLVLVLATAYQGSLR